MTSIAEFDLCSFGIVITGASGFLGRRIAHIAQKKGADICCITHTPTEGLQSKLHTASDFLQAYDEKKRIFIHLAGIADAKKCEQNPTLAQTINVNLLDYVIQEVEAIQGCVLVFPSTGYVYANTSPKSALTENDDCNPKSIYACGKYNAEQKIFASKNLCGAVIARLSNVYGPHGGENTVIGRIVMQSRLKKALCVHDESPIRDFIFVDNVAEALLRLALLARGEKLLVNVSTGIGSSISDVLHIVANITGLARKPQELHPHGGRLVLNNDLLCALTKWYPSVSLEQGLNIILQSEIKNET